LYLNNNPNTFKAINKKFARHVVREGLLLRLCKNALCLIQVNKIGSREISRFDKAKAL